jgi:hypothetical protein
LNTKTDAAILAKWPSRLFKDIATASIGIAGYNLKDTTRKWGYGAQL